jgi:hypothetical protein
MKKTVLVALALLSASGTASAATATGAGALALAALVAAHSPLVSGHDKRAMALLLNGNLGFSFPKNKKILVRADAIVCRAGNVDITAHSCTLTFGNKTTVLKGRRAHELFATIAEAGVPARGAAGSVFESLSHLVCTIDPNGVKQRAGGGADCKFDTGSP